MKEVYYQLKESDNHIKIAATNAIQFARGHADSDNGIVKVKFHANGIEMTAYNGSLAADIVEKYHLAHELQERKLAGYI